jgi:DNA-binding MarR family transcriptional regulator
MDEIGLFERYINDVAGLQLKRRQRLMAPLLPFLRQRYELYQMDLPVLGVEVTAIVVLDPDHFAPAEFEKHLRQFPLEVQRRYIVVAKTLPSYVRHRLVERGIPFAVPGVQLSWPDLGAAVRQRGARKPAVMGDQVRPATQAVIVGALAGTVTEDVNVRDAAHLLGYTPMTMTRAFDELEGIGLAEALRLGHERRLHLAHHGRALWEAARPKLRDPVRKTLRLPEEAVAAGHPLLAGESALAETSMLAPPSNPVYAVGPEGWAEVKRGQPQEVPVADAGTCLLQVWAYEPGALGRDGRVDPFSLALTLGNVEDERIAAAVDEMMEKVTW